MYFTKTTKNFFTLHFQVSISK